MTQKIQVFDGHNDLLLKLFGLPHAARDQAWLQGDGKGHLDLKRMQKGGFAGGFFAIYIPSPEDGFDFSQLRHNPPYDVPMPAMMDLADAQPVAMEMAGILMRMERTSQGQFKICRSFQDIQDCMAKGVVAGIMHMEGAEAIGADLDALYAFHEMGLRSLGPVWSRPTVFGEGVPLRFPGDPDVGGGLTDAGKDLIRICNELKILVDLSHMNEKGFDDVARLSDAPLVATHSNAHAVTPCPRNLTDRQLKVIRDSGGMVGLNFGTIFLNTDGKGSTDVPWDTIMLHLDHLIGVLGEDHVGIGSDFDGTDIPDVIGDAAGLPNLTAALESHGYSTELIEKLAYRNWLAVLERTWGA